MAVQKHIAIVGAGPAGLIAAEVLAEAGHAVCVYDRMPSPGRKLLIAGRGGLNLTHSEPLNLFLTRYGEAATWLSPAIRAFPPDALRTWCEGLGEETFIGSSGRIFPRRMKASTLLRAWLRRLESLGVQYRPRHTWLGWQGDALHFSNPAGGVQVTADATLLALGGASWPHLGSDGGWFPILDDQQIVLSPLRPANCGFLVDWSDHIRGRFAGVPLKPVAITHDGVTRQGEAMITAGGIEGGAIYALASGMREAIARDGSTTITLDLRPAMTVEALRRKLAGRGSKSLSSALKSANFDPLAIALLHEAGKPAAGDLSASLKALPLTLTGTTGLDRAISSAGGVRRAAVTDDYMLRARPGTFVAGEMLDWEAPTGGYLLQACFSTGMAAARGVMNSIS
jgi:uncharacterized flavoprotein (TIGR03862 family)